MISALADAGAALERADYVAAAVACARVHRARAARRRRPAAAHVQPRPREAPGLPRGPRVPARGVPDALRGDVRRALVRARAWRSPTTILERFHDPERGGFFSIADDHTGLIARRKDLEDAPIPSGGSAACFGLLRLARLTGEARYEDAALSLIQLLHTVAPEHPLAFGHLLRAIDFHLGAGPRGRAGGRRRRAARARRARRRSARTSCWPAASRRRPAARGPRPGRRPRRRLRLRALHLPAAGHRASRAESD